MSTKRSAAKAAETTSHVPSKQCSKCTLAKPISEFSLRALTSGRIGLRGDCKPCRAREKRQRRHRKSPRPKGRRENVVLFPKNTDLTPLGRWLVRKAVQKRAGVSATHICTLSAEWVHANQGQTHCPITGMPFRIGAVSSDGQAHALSPSLDRKDNSKPYTDENTQIISLWANRAKSTLSEMEFHLLLVAAADRVKSCRVH
jgi:hypothetical protein